MPTALITGATSGIGRAFAERLAADGWDLVLVARDGGRLERVAHRLGGAEVIAADLASPHGQAMVVARLAEGPVDLLVNNAGRGAGQPFLTGSAAVEDEMFEVNAHAVLRHGRAAHGGHHQRVLGRRVGAARQLRRDEGLRAVPEPYGGARGCPVRRRRPGAVPWHDAHGVPRAVRE
jgi:short-subunit dehydrogenase